MIFKLENKINQGARITLEKKENGIMKYVEFENYLFNPSMIRIKEWEEENNLSPTNIIGNQELRTVLSGYIGKDYQISLYPHNAIDVIPNISKIEPVYFYKKDFNEDGYHYYKIEFINSNAPKLYQSYFLIREWKYDEFSEEKDTVITTNIITSNKKLSNFIKTILEKVLIFFYGSEIFKNGEEYFNCLICGVRYVKSLS